MLNYIYLIVYGILAIVGFLFGMNFGLLILEMAELSMFSFLSFVTGAAGTLYGTAILNNFCKRLRLKRIHALKTGKISSLKISNRFQDTLWAVSAVVADIVIRPLLSVLSALMLVFVIGTNPGGIIIGTVVGILIWVLLGAIIAPIWNPSKLEQSIELANANLLPRADRRR